MLRRQRSDKRHVMSRLETSFPSPAPPLRTLPLALSALAMVLMPWLASWWATGALASSAREVWISTVASLLAAGFGVWVIVLLRRERHLVRRHLLDLEALTLTDPLTGLGNRRALERDVARAMLRSNRLDQPLTLLFLDVDDLKAVNDRFGHAAGDETLRMVGAVARSCSREGTDTGYRVGGDEFVLILTADREGADVVCGRMQQGFQSRSPYGSTISLGVVEWDGAQSAGELLSQADVQMYQNKHMGRRNEASARRA